LARFLAIDWEQQQLHIVQGSTVRGGVRVAQALTWALPEPLTATAAEGLGKKLREALKEANVAAAPVLACVGRERVILKELRYPAVPANEEPAIVRFQAAKELTESADDCIIDYTPMGNGDPAERHALAVIVKKEVINSLQGLCRGLGMKLLAVTPRPAAVIGAVYRNRHGEVPVGAVEALLTIGPRWADLGVLRGQTLLFARSLGVGATLTSEVKRSLAVFNAGSEAAVEKLFVASDGDETSLCSRLHEMLGIPVQFLDSFQPGDAVQVDKARRGRFTAAIGLLQRWSEKPELGINFVSPKEPKVTENPRKRQKVFAAVIGLVVFGFLVAFGSVVLAGKKEQIRELVETKNDLEDKLKRFSQESADVNYLKDWKGASISWLDELYDLTARFPNQEGFRIVSIAASPIKKNSAKDKFVASVNITGMVQPKDVGKVNELVNEINKTAGLKAVVGNSATNAGTANNKQGTFSIRVDLVRQPLDKYTLKIPRGKGPIVPAEDDPGNEGNEGDAAGNGE
jgi:Tfp pilus assembly PilM family ATPase